MLSYHNQNKKFFIEWALDQFDAMGANTQELQIEKNRMEEDEQYLQQVVNFFEEVINEANI